MTIVIFIALLALLVLVHECGHFFVARWHGVTPEEFGFGFPPRIGGIVKDAEGRWRIVRRSDHTVYPTTVYSVNWIPLGGFVRIKGEDGTDHSAGSFAMKSPWVRFQILVAGVVMNVILAWVLATGALMIGMPITVDDTVSGADIRIERVLPESPADTMGLRSADQILAACDYAQSCATMTRVADVQQFTRTHAGEMVTFVVRRGIEDVSIQGVLRANHESGTLGVMLAATQTRQWSFMDAVVQGARITGSMLWMIVQGIGVLFWGLITGQAASLDVTGPVGIAMMTGHVTDLGIAYLLQFGAMLSANLAIINILPIPALDGGRILFVFLEVVRRGRPINRRIEGIVHGISFAVLLGLMLLITVRDVMHLF